MPRNPRKPQLSALFAIVPNLLQNLESHSFFKEETPRKVGEFCAAHSEVYTRCMGPGLRSSDQDHAHKSISRVWAHWDLQGQQIRHPSLLRNQQPLFSQAAYSRRAGPSASRYACTTCNVTVTSEVNGRSGAPNLIASDAKIFFVVGSLDRCKFCVV